MCGIAGYLSFDDNRPETKKLMKMFSELETRGTDASGIAYPHDGKLVVFKKNVPSSKLINLQEFHAAMGRSPSAMIFHCRATTHGSAAVNSNNHPVYSGDKVALVHNGVIQNHNTIGTKPDGVEVDTMAILHLANTYSNAEMFSESVSKLYGSMACAVLRQEKDDIKLWLFRECNPITYIQDKEDGILYFASTDYILSNIQAKGTMYDMPAKVMLSISQKTGSIEKLCRFQMKDTYATSTSSTVCHGFRRREMTASIMNVGKYWSPDSARCATGSVRYTDNGIWEKRTDGVWTMIPFKKATDTVLFRDKHAYPAQQAPPTKNNGALSIKAVGGSTDQNHEPNSIEKRYIEMIHAGKQTIALGGSGIHRLQTTHIISEPNPEEEVAERNTPFIRIPTYGLSAVCPHCDDWRQPYRSVNVEEQDCYRCCVCNTVIPEEDVIVIADTLDSMAF